MTEELRSSPFEREQAFDAQVRANLPRNYTGHLAHGLLGQTGFRLINAPTFIPAYVYALTGSNLIVGLARALQALGMSLTPVFAASVVEHRKKVLPVGFIVGMLMRVQVLGIALSGFFLPPQWNAVAVCAFLGLFGFFLGMQGVIFNFLVSKVIPVDKRGALVGLRNFLAGIGASMMGGFGGWLIDQNTFGNGYATTFLAAFVLTAAGLCMLLIVREPDSPIVRHKTDVLRRLRDIPAMLRDDSSYTFYFVARALGSAGRMAVPFYVIYAKTKLDVSGTELGLLTGAFVLAQSSFQLLWGLVADRTGFRATFLSALILWVLSALLLLSTSSFGWLLVVFAALGAGLGGFMMSSQNLVLEFGDRQDLPMRIAVANASSEAVGVVGPLVAGLLADSASYTLVFGTAIACKALAFGVMALWVREPRLGNDR